MRMEKNLLILLICCFVVTSCNWAQPGISGEGAVVTKELDLENFTGVSLAAAGKIYLTQGTTQKVTVEAQQNVIDNLKTEVKNGNWGIGFKENMRNYKSLIIRITVPQIDDLSIAGSGTIIGENAFNNLGDLSISVAGSGDVKLSGTADKVSVSIAGSGDVDIQDLKAQNAKVSISGSGDCKVDVSGALDVSIAGSGDVAYKGSPRVSSSVSGSGKVKSM